MDGNKEDMQVCRLCGKYEKIFIEVFGEMGVKHSLRNIVNMKLKIQIDEDDPLPKVICVKCLGKLEFFASFEEKCAQIQKMLHDRQLVTESVEVKDKDSTSSAGTSSAGTSSAGTSSAGTSSANTSSSNNKNK